MNIFEKMDKKNMLRALVSHYANGSNAQMARILNVTPQAISTWLSRGTFDAELIFSKCENVSPEWLFTGSGPMLRPGHDDDDPMAVNDRIGEVINKFAGGDLEQFAKTIDVDIRELQGTISMRLFAAGYSLIEKILQVYPSVSYDYLMFGKGEMLKPESNTESIPIAIPPPDHSIGIPLIPIEAVAGWSGVDVPGVSIANCEAYHIPDFIAAGAEFLIRVSGSSMYPKYSSGDILACRKIKDITFFQWGKIYVIDSSQGVMVKRLFESDSSGCLLCKSDNDKYHPFDLPKDDIRSISIVVGVVRLE